MGAAASGGARGGARVRGGAEAVWRGSGLRVSARALAAGRGGQQRSQRGARGARATGGREGRAPRLVSEGGQECRTEEGPLGETPSLEAWN